MARLHQRPQAERDPPLELHAASEIFLSRRPGSGMKVRNVRASCRVGARFIHGYMTIRTNAQDRHIDALPFGDETFDIVAFFFQIRSPSIEKTDPAGGDTQGMKKSFVQVVTAGAFILSVHAYPFVQSDKIPMAHIEGMIR